MFHLASEEAGPSSEPFLIRQPVSPITTTFGLSFLPHFGRGRFSCLMDAVRVPSGTSASQTTAEKVPIGARRFIARDLPSRTIAGHRAPDWAAKRASVVYPCAPS